MSVRQGQRSSGSLCVAEALEGRQLLHAGHPEVIGTTLVIEGLEGRDRIELKLLDKKTYSATINGATETVKASRVTAIRISGEGGKDRITIKGSLGRLPVTLSGGDGNDQITGNRDNEFIFGDGGRDTIDGGGGDDRIKGGGGDDLIFGGLGNDNISGDSGNDGLYGDAGNDKLFGKGGHDILGGDDEDTLRFSLPRTRDDIFGNDLLDGGEGNDILRGGVASNTSRVNGQLFLLPDATGRDTFIGGGGADILDARGADDVLRDQSGQDFVPAVQFSPAREQVGDAHTHAFIYLHFREGGGSTEFLVPNAVGIYTTGLAEVHTHDENNPADRNRIHYESPDHSGYTLAEFFQQWGITFSAERIGRYSAREYPIEMKVNDAASTQFGAYRPQQNDRIDVYIG